MKKSNVIIMNMGVVGSLLFSIGMCMSLLPEWGLFNQGIIAAGAGILTLLATYLKWRKNENKAPIKFNGTLIKRIFVGFIGSILLGICLCFTMIWSNMLVGIAIGVVGIMILLSLIPMILGVKEA